MYISSLRILNYRCFDCFTVDFNPGVNVIIGENNSGKTSLLKALGLLFDRSSRPRMQIYDFHQGIEDFSKPPSIAISATLTSSPHDTIQDKALVATWLTKLESPWEAQLTYLFSLAEEAVPAFHRELGDVPERKDKEKFWKIIQRYLPKYVSRIFGGLLDTQMKAEGEFLNKFDYQFLDAIRDVESELFSGSNPMLRNMLQQVLDIDAPAATILERESEFGNMAQQLTKSLVERINLPTLIELINRTGAEDGGIPALGGTVTENDLITALRLFISREGLNLPASHNGLGYNNLLYISLVLASLKFKSSVDRRGPNAVLFPMLVIEEPEAHLHPSLQHKLLRYIRERVEQTQDSRQVFLTTHSTHITAASELDSIICMQAPQRGHGVRVSYPGRAFPETSEGIASKKYVERYLDATKSNMLFAKGIILVEGIAEQLLIPCLAESIGVPLEDKHVAVIAVGGSTFKHFVPIFGATDSGEVRQCTLDRPVSCLLDADPMMKKKDARQREKCWPFQIPLEGTRADCAFSTLPDKTQYFPRSGVARNLEVACCDCANIKVYSGGKTLEYDLAIANPCSHILINAVMSGHKNELAAYVRNPTAAHDRLSSLLDDETNACLAGLGDPVLKKHTTFATYYVKCVEACKGEHAFDLSCALRRNLTTNDKIPFETPPHIKDAILWAAGLNCGGFGQ